VSAPMAAASDKEGGQGAASRGRRGLLTRSGCRCGGWMACTRARSVHRAALDGVRVFVCTRALSARSAHRDDEC